MYRMLVKNKNVRSVFTQTPHRALHNGKSTIVEWELTSVSSGGDAMQAGSPREMKAESNTAKVTVF